MRAGGHLQQLDQLFNQLRTFGLKTKLPKYEFRAPNLHYVVFRLNPEGIDKLKAVKYSEIPRNIKKSGNSQGYANSSEATSKTLH
jgi:hypothetical protein